MAFAGPLGFVYALVNAPAQTMLHERAPAEMRGRVFAAQVVLANAVGILPLDRRRLRGRYLRCDARCCSPSPWRMAAIAGFSIYFEAKWSIGA